MQDGPCKCFTEQITRFAMPEAQCRDIARNGMYNPFRQPLKAQDDGTFTLTSSSSAASSAAAGIGLDGPGDEGGSGEDGPAVQRPRGAGAFRH